MKELEKLMDQAFKRIDHLEGVIQHLCPHSNQTREGDELVCDLCRTIIHVYEPDYDSEW